MPLTTRSFLGMSATDVAPVASLPTTAAHFCVWNGEKSGGKTYLITSLGLVVTTSAAAVIVLNLIAQVSPYVSVPVISGTVASGPKAIDGLGNTSNAVVASAVTIQNTGIWHPVGQSIVCAGTADIGLGQWTDVSRVGYSLPPGGLLSLAGFCSAAGSAKCQLMATWQEVQL